MAKTRRRPKQVRQRPGGEQHRRQHQRVGVHDPLEVGEAGVELALDVRQRDVHHRDVQQQHERGEADGDEGPATGCHPLCMPFVSGISRQGGPATICEAMFGGGSIQLGSGLRHPHRRGRQLVLRPLPDHLVAVGLLRGPLPGRRWQGVCARNSQRAAVLPVDPAARAGPRRRGDPQRHPDLGHRPVDVRRRREARARHRLAGRGVPRRDRRAAGDARHRALCFGSDRAASWPAPTPPSTPRPFEDGSFDEATAVLGYLASINLLRARSST